MACGCTEDGAHFLRCRHPARLWLWEEFIAAVSQTAASFSLDPYLRRLLLTILCPLANQSPPDITALPQAYLALLIRQQALGPDSWFAGLIHLNWVTLQHASLTHRKLPNNRQQAFTAIKALLNLTWEHLHSLWLLRNEHLHGIHESNHPPYVRTHLLTRIAVLYRQRDDMLPADRDIFSISLEARQAQNTSTLRAFYGWAAPIVTASIRDARFLGNRGQKITNYFQRAIPPVPPWIHDVILIPTRPCT